MEAHYLIRGPAIQIDKSPFDNTAPPLFSKRILIFSRSPDQRPEEAVRVLRSGLQAAVNRLPILACNVIPDTKATQGGVRAFSSDKGAAHLIVKDLTQELDFDELKAAKFPQSRLLPEVLNPNPSFADPRAECPVCKVQANFIRGGLLLVWSIHHFAADGAGVTTLLQEFAEQCRLVQEPRDDGTSETESVFPADALDRSLLFRGVSPGSEEKLLRYYVVLPEPPAGPPKWLNVEGMTLVTDTFRISANDLAHLKKEASPTLKTSWISTFDAFAALVWRTVMKARYDAGVFANDHIVVEMAIPTSFRRLIEPKLPSEYVGNAYLVTTPRLTIGQLVAPSSLAAAARAIRDAVSSINTEYVDNFSAVMRSVKDTRQLHNNIMDDIPLGRQIMLSSFHKWPHMLDWGRAIGKYEAFRLPAGGPNGVFVVMPPLQDGSWEVSMTLEEHIMSKVKDDELWIEYTDKVYEEKMEATVQVAEESG